MHTRDVPALRLPSASNNAHRYSVVEVQVGPQFFSPTVILCCTSRQRVRLAERGYSALARRGRWRDIGDEDPFHCGLKYSPSFLLCTCNRRSKETNNNNKHLKRLHHAVSVA